MDEPIPADPPALAPKKPVPGILQSLGLCAIFLFAFIVAAVVMGLLAGFAGVTLDMFAALFVQQMIAWPVTIWAGLRWAGSSFREACPLRPFPSRIVPPLLVASFGATILLLEAASWIPFPEGVAESLAEQVANSNKMFRFLSVVIVAPVAEELFFRGQVFRGYLGRYTTTTAVLASAALFALFHLNPWQAIVAFPLGIGYAWLVLRTGSLWPGLLSHAMVNFSTNFLLGPLWTALGYDVEQMYSMDHFPASILAIGAAATIVGVVIVWRQMRPPLMEAALAPAAE